MCSSFFGLFSGWALNTLLRKNLIPHFLINVLSLAFVIFAFAGADSLQPESGLLSVTVMGIFLANVKTPNIDKILDFKESFDSNFDIRIVHHFSFQLKIRPINVARKEVIYVFLVVVLYFDHSQFG